MPHSLHSIKRLPNMNKYKLELKGSLKSMVAVMSMVVIKK
jgi:hypothetical protein